MTTTQPALPPFAVGVDAELRDVLTPVGRDDKVVLASLHLMSQQSNEREMASVDFEVLDRERFAQKIAEGLLLPLTTHEVPRVAYFVQACRDAGYASGRADATAEFDDA
jgi:hypothetical protein